MNGKKIGRKLMNLRQGKPRRDVAKSLGISVSTLTMYELGNRIPRDEFKVELAKYYNTSVGELFFEE